MTDRAALLTRCLEQPDDDTVRLAYADHLDEIEPIDHDRAAFIRTQVELARLESDPRRYACKIDGDHCGDPACPANLWLKDRNALWPVENELLNWHAHEWLFELPPGFRPILPDAIKATYHRGLVHRLGSTLADWQEHAGAILAAHPVVWIGLSDVPGLVYRVVRNDQPDHWRLMGRLSTRPGFPVDAPDWSLRTDGYQWTLSHPTRADLVAHVAADVATIMDELRGLAGDQWPGSFPSEPTITLESLVDGEVAPQTFCALSGTVNATPFRGYKAGALLCTGVSGRAEGGGVWRLTYSFAVAPQRILAAAPDTYERVDFNREFPPPGGVEVVPALQPGDPVGWSAEGGLQRWPRGRFMTLPRGVNVTVPNHPYGHFPRDVEPSLYCVRCLRPSQGDPMPSGVCAECQRFRPTPAPHTPRG